MRGRRSRRIDGERLCRGAPCWGTKIEVHVEVEQPKSARKRHFLAISDVDQNGVHAKLFHSKMIDVSFGGLVWRVMKTNRVVECR